MAGVAASLHIGLPAHGSALTSGPPSTDWSCAGRHTVLKPTRLRTIWLCTTVRVVNDPTGIEAQVCFSLYAASRAVTGLYRPALDAVGLTYPQYVAMLVIWHRGSVTVRDLGTALDLDSGTLSPLLKRLETQGLIRRQRGIQDERTVCITVTPLGSALHEQVGDLPQRLACAIDLSPDELRHLHHLLERVRESATRNPL